MALNNPVSLGDAARIQKELQPQNARTWNRILKLLGLPLELREEPAEEKKTGVHEPLVEPAAGHRPQKGFTEEPTVDTPRSTPAPVFAPGGEILVQWEGKAVVPPPPWGQSAHIFSLGQKKVCRRAPRPPIFSPGQGRPLLTALAIAQVETGELDEDRAVEQLARGEPLREIPLQRRPSSRWGVQLLLDRGPRMEPLRYDQQSLLEQLRRTVGEHRVAMLQFADFPDEAGPGSRLTWRPYEPPAAGTVVVVVSDLGMGWFGTSVRTRQVSDWIAWARRVRSAGARPVALVPHGPDYWTGDLRRHLRLVHWDRSTTVGVIRGQPSL